MRAFKPDEKSLLIALKAGDHAAFKYFYEKYGSQLYRKLLRMVQVDVVARELLQDLFIKIWEKREQVDPEQAFRAYLYRIAERMVYDHYRRLTREAALERAIARSSSDTHNSTEEGIHIKEVRGRIDKAIDQLPTQQRRIFTLCKIEGRSYEEVGKLMGITTATVNTHITRASQTVRDYLLKHYDGAAALMWACTIVSTAF